MSSIASSTTIHNEMLKQCPDLVEVLSQLFFVDRKVEVPEGKMDYYQIAVFHHFGGYLTTIYVRDFINAAQRHPEVQRLTDKQIEAMDMFDAIAASPTIRLDMMLERGDLQLIHNHQIVHSRTSYEDWPEPERKRHLLRLRLSQAERYGNIERGTRRGGIIVPGAVERVTLVAE